MPSKADVIHQTTNLHLIDPLLYVHRSSRVYASLTHEERVCLSDGTFHGRAIGDIADRTGLSRLDVANALLLPELERRWADRLRALRATRLPEVRQRPSLFPMPA